MSVTRPGRAPRPAAGGAPGALRLGLNLEPGMRVGLFGGSFNPAHEGHAHVAQTALRRLGLDQVIWLAAPQNPLTAAAVPLEARLASASAWTRARHVLSDAERRLGARYTIDTVRRLTLRFPAVRFVWVMGADSLAGLHRWRAWPQLMAEIPIAVVARPGSTIRALTSPAVRRFASARLPEREARRLAFARPPAWVWLTGPWNWTSSTALRDLNARRDGKADGAP
ncbi:MAG TPA: nicotinate-nucleotide adenylyltransferase [Caulobacteraceae bacterium]|nr:nicotinate-nucleotide adenylyltransferase [Caulobacteraceae bacterium]